MGERNLHAVMVPVLRCAASASPVGEWHTLHVLQRQRRKELRHDARVGLVLEPGTEGDQRWLAERGADEAETDGQAEDIAHRHVDDRVADDGGEL